MKPTDAEILEVARGYWSFNHLRFNEITFARRMFDLGAAQENEECAKVCADAHEGYWIDPEINKGYRLGTKACATKIRARRKAEMNSEQVVRWSVGAVAATLVLLFIFLLWLFQPF